MAAGAAVISVMSTSGTGLQNLIIVNDFQLKTSNFLSHKIIPTQTQLKKKKIFKNKFNVLAITKGSSSSSKSNSSSSSSGGESAEVVNKIPSWAKPDSEEPPPWAQREDSSNGTSKELGTFEIPFYAYLLASTITAIAAIGSVFEYVNQKPVFGLLNSDSIFYAPVLGFFALTGVPTSAFLWYKSVQAANKAAEEQDRRDGY